MRLLVVILFILWTIARHEGSHALVAYWEGAEIRELRLFPGFDNELGFYFGYVKYSGDTTWLTECAPYFSDVLLIALTGAILLKSVGKKFYNELLVFGLISPIVDLVYNYQGGLWRTGTDVSDLLNLLPNLLVHFSFILVITSAVLMLLYFRKRLSLTNELN